MLKNANGWHLQSHELYPKLGITHGKLPPNGFERVIDGVKFICIPHQPHANGRKSSKHRLFYECDCGKRVPFGRAHQHVKGRQHKLDVRRRKREALERQVLTDEEKKRWAPMLHATWNAIAYDFQDSLRFSGMKLTKSLIVEAVCDANRVQMFGGMTNEEYEFLCVIWNRPSGQRWLSETLNYV